MGASGITGGFRVGRKSHAPGDLASPEQKAESYYRLQGKELRPLRARNGLRHVLALHGRRSGLEEEAVAG